MTSPHKRTQFTAQGVALLHRVGSSPRKDFDTIIDDLEATERELRAIEARKLQLMAEAFAVSNTETPEVFHALFKRDTADRRAELDSRELRAELACMLHESETSIERQLGLAWELTSLFATVFEALQRGEISTQHARVVTQAGQVIGADDTVAARSRRAEYAEQVLEYARETSPNRLRPIARKLAEQFAERSIDERFEQATKRRSLTVRDADDGMAELIAYLPAAEAHGIYNRVRKMGRVVAIARGSEGRCADAIRADVFVDILCSRSPERTAAQLDEDHELGRIQAEVQVLLPGELLEPGQHTLKQHPVPATLQGFGPIDSSTARRLASDAEAWDTIHTNPESFAVIAVDRYRPTAEQRRYLRARDQHCRFPGCRAPLARCDIDHTHDAARGGPTATDNLAHLCRGHHTLKHHTKWRVEQHDAGELEWTSPTGRAYRERPPSTVMFMPPDTMPF